MSQPIAQDVRTDADRADASSRRLRFNDAPTVIEPSTPGSSTTSVKLEEETLNNDDRSSMHDDLGIQTPRVGGPGTPLPQGMYAPPPIHAMLYPSGTPRSGPPPPPSPYHPNAPTIPFQTAFNTAGSTPYYSYAGQTTPAWGVPPSTPWATPGPSSPGAVPNAIRYMSTGKSLDEGKLDSDHPFWSMYMVEATGRDNEMLQRAGANLDALLVFSGLFSAVLTAFLIESYQLLQPDPAEESAALLSSILVVLRETETNTGGLAPVSDATEAFSIPPALIAVNALWFASLVITLGSSLVCLLLKQILTGFSHGLRAGSPLEQAHRHQFRQENFERWRISRIIEALPTLLHAALGLFLLGLIVFLWSISTVVAGITLTIGALFLFIYLTTVGAPLLSPATPFPSPLLQELLTIVTTDLLQRPLVRTLRKHVARLDKWDLGSPVFTADVEYQAITSKRKELANATIEWAITTSRDAAFVAQAVNALGRRTFFLQSTDNISLCTPLLVEKLKQRVSSSWESGWKSYTFDEDELRTLLCMVRQRSSTPSDTDGTILHQWRTVFATFPFGDMSRRDPAWVAIVESLRFHVSRLCEEPVDWDVMVASLRVCIVNPAATSTALTPLLDALILALSDPNVAPALAFQTESMVNNIIRCIIALSDNIYWEEKGVRTCGMLILHLLSMEPPARRAYLVSIKYDALHPTLYPAVEVSHEALPVVFKHIQSVVPVDSNNHDSPPLPSKYGITLVARIFRAQRPYLVYSLATMLDLVEYIPVVEESAFTRDLLESLSMSLSNAASSRSEKPRLFNRLCQFAGPTSSLFQLDRADIIQFLATSFSATSHVPLTEAQGFSVSAIPNLHTSLNQVFVTGLESSGHSVLCASATGLARQLHCEASRAICWESLYNSNSIAFELLTDLFDWNRGHHAAAVAEREIGLFRQALTEWASLPLEPSHFAPGVDTFAVWKVAPFMLEGMSLSAQALLKNTVGDAFLGEEHEEFRRTARKLRRAVALWAEHHRQGWKVEETELVEYSRAITWPNYSEHFQTSESESDSDVYVPRRRGPLPQWRAPQGMHGFR